MENCNTNITITQTEEICGGKYTSSSCVSIPNNITYLDVSAGDSQTTVNAALVTALMYKDEQINSITSAPTENLQKVINYLTDFTDGTYTLSNIDNNYSIFIENLGYEDPLSTLNILIPSGLISQFKVRILQKGTGLVYIIGSVTKKLPTNRFSGISDKNDWVYIEQLFNTNEYYINGALMLPQ